MTGEPEAQDGYVAFEQGQRPVLYDPAEAEVLAMNLLSAAASARAHRIARGDETAESGGEDAATRRIV